jgi:hypothetical protein
MVVSPTALGHGNGDAAVHEFSVAANGDLWDGFTSDINDSTLAFTVTDISAQAGSTVSTSTPVSALYLGGSNPSTQVFALTPAGQLLSFVALGDGAASGHTWQVFDLSTMSGSTAFLTTGPQAIQFGSTVHVYVTDSNKHLRRTLRVRRELHPGRDHDQRRRSGHRDPERQLRRDASPRIPGNPAQAVRG